MMTDKQKKFLTALLISVAGWAKEPLTLPEGITKGCASKAIALLVEARDLVGSRVSDEALKRYPALYHRAEEIIGLRP